MNQNPESQPKEWFPSRIISGEEHIALLILNQPLQEECKYFVKRNWQSALVHVGVDGGANQLKELCDDEFPLIPDLICGDFDSATPDVLEFYKSKVSSIIAVARNGDRLDHILGNLNTLYQADEITSVPVLILGNNSLTWLLSVGFHKIYVTEKMMESHVGLIPLGSACKNVTTTGLKWNLTNDKMNFGGLISTCNMFDGSNVVTIATDTPLIWTMEVTMDKF
ncbi:thiamin pyrophosphokinase 1-like isoform X2 [Argiope bruennichi]|uniref:thiamin pyrophosphokinase 1-like isoform X2 n=1 Tax=Argiope bruennichi TaxID=94029 RepID=UPI0024942E33|nr:thiamin pyrophosphokinase 1-like isoform X2 [Argiope bruennichi]